MMAACAAALISAAAWALGSILFRKIGDYASPLGMNLGKDLIGLALLGTVLLVLGIQPIEPRAVIVLLLSGVVGIAIGDTLFFAALVRLDPRLTLLLATVGQVFTVLLAVVLLEERPSVRAWGGIALVLVSVAWVLREQTELEPSEERGRYGVLFGLGAAACFAGAIILAKVGVESVSALEGTVIRLVGGVAGLVVLGLVRRDLGAWLTPFKDPQAFRAIVTAEFVIIVGGFWMGLYALKHLEAWLATVLSSTEPLMVLPLAVWLLGDKVTSRAVAGAAAAVVGVALIVIT